PSGPRGASPAEQLAQEVVHRRVAAGAVRGVGARRRVAVVAVTSPAIVAPALLALVAGAQNGAESLHERVEAAALALAFAEQALPQRIELGIGAVGIGQDTRDVGIDARIAPASFDVDRNAEAERIGGASLALEARDEPRIELELHRLGREVDGAG